MSLLEFVEDDGPGWTRVGKLYEVTRKPRGLDLSSVEAIPFTPMDAIPEGDSYAPGFVLKAPNAITSGTYYERGDLLVAKALAEQHKNLLFARGERFDRLLFGSRFALLAAKIGQ